MSNMNPIRAWRISQGLSQRELGERLGVNDSAVTKWEKTKVSADKALQLHRITGIPLHRLRPDLYPAPQTNGAAA